MHIMDASVVKMDIPIIAFVKSLYHNTLITLNPCKLLRNLNTLLLTPWWRSFQNERKYLGRGRQHLNPLKKQCSFLGKGITS